ncbi:MAG: FkbM family methyltransferase, partial [Thermoleophilaceae bacterium]
GMSLVRRRVPALATARAGIGAGVRVRADLGTPLGLRLYRYGFCDPEAEVLRGLLAPGDVFVDGGANVGLFTLTAAAAVGPRGRVLAFEPAEQTMALLRANVELNRFGWVELHQLGLAERSGSETLYTFGPGAGLSSFAPAAAGRAEEIPTATLDEMAHRHADRVRLVKLDVEGAELRALEGSRRLLESARPAFMLEVEPEHLARQGASVAAIQELFAGFDYRAFWIGRDTGGPFVSPADGEWTGGDGDPNVLVLASERLPELPLRIVP